MRKIICLRKSKVYAEGVSVCFVTEGAGHTLSDFTNLFFNRNFKFSQTFMFLSSHLLRVI